MASSGRCGPQRPLPGPNSTRTSSQSARAIPTLGLPVAEAARSSSQLPSVMQDALRPYASNVSGLASERIFLDGSLPALDPEEQQVAARRSRRRHQRKPRKSKSSRHLSSSVRRSRKIRGNILSCTLSAIVLLVVLSIYLSVTLTHVESQEFHVTFILVILVASIVFCHSLICLCVLSMRPSGQNEEMLDMPAMAGLRGYANPSRPIRVTLVRDEEAAGLESQTVKYPPPAYGLWRESVRVDPARIYWARNESQPSKPDVGADIEETLAAQRPPSYALDDEIEHANSAIPAR